MNDSADQQFQETLEVQPPPVPNEFNDEGEEAALEQQGENDIEGELSSSIQIAPTANGSEIVSIAEDDPFLFIELGDRVVIDSNVGRTSGTVYYRSADLIRVLPDGISNILRDYPVEQTEQGEIFDESLGVKVAYVIEKRKFESFVEQRDLRLGQTVETITSSGDIDKVFKITLVDEENDAVEMEDESGASERVEFGFYGVPLDESFVIIRSRQEEDTGAAEGAAEGEQREEEEKEDEDEDEIAELPAPKIKIVGFVTLTKATVFKEAPATQQRFPDNLQKTDALNDFLNMLDPALQKDPKAIREVRHLIETLFYLKQDTVAYNDDGSVKGQKEVSAITIADLIKRTTVPLGRPILDVAKKLYLQPAEEAINDGEEGVSLEGDEYFFINQRDELTQMVQNKGALVSSDMNGAQNGQINQFWYNTSTNARQYQSTFTPNNTAEPLWKANYDSEFFRNQLPDLENPSIEGYIPPEADSGATEPIFDKISFGLERALTTTYRKGVERKKQLLVPEESATMKGYLIFPQKVVAHIGKSRSGSIAVDSGRSQLPPKTTKQILEEVGDAQEVGTSNDLILLDVNGATLGNIPLKDYIDGLTIPSLGLGDTFKTLEQYGIDNLELTPDIIQVLESKIEAYQSQLLGTLTKLREELAAAEIKEPEENNLIDNITLFEGNIRNEPTLVEDMETFEKINPSLSKSDIARVAYLLQKHSDYFQVAAGGNGVYTAKERVQSTRNMFLESLEIARLLKLKKTDVGEPPLPNKCEHVAKLNTIRKEYDDNDRFQLLTKFFAYYQGDRQDNWINCNRCDRQLLCVHERLLIQSYLNPAEKDAIFKEIVLNFSGGQFQGKYICRNCGQAIRDIDFDTNLEYDDNGKPMSGRAVLEDKDAKFEQKLNQMISAPIGTNEVEIEDADKDDKSKTGLQLNDKEKEYYAYISEISERLAIVLRDEHMKRAISRTMNLVNKLHTREQYKKFKEKNPAIADYDVMLSRETICACAAFILIEIQSARPSYPIHRILHGCKDPGFDGYPLEPDIDKKQGIMYISCALASIHRNDAPWNKTGFHSKKGVSLDSKITSIAQIILRIVKSNVSNDEIQQQISDKKKYLLQIAGKEAASIQAKDEIPATFLPEQIILSKSKAAEDATIPEVANLMGEKGKYAVAKQWIRESHELALKTASLVRGSPLIETTCCLSNITRPNTFWSSASDLPDLDKRKLTPKVQGAFLQVHFNPRPMESLLVEADKDIYYRIFLKYCFQGPRYGHLHEPGLTNKCAWCGFQFPVNPNILDTDTEGKSALITQSVTTDTEQFTELLDKIHQVNAVDAIKPRRVSTMDEIMNEFSNITPEPTPNWKAVIDDTIVAFSRMPKDVNAGDVATALIEISNESSELEQVVRQRVNENFIGIIEEIIRLPWLNFYQVIQAYFIIPFKRIVTNFSSDSIFVPKELKISELHTNDITRILSNDMSLLSMKAGDIRKPAAMLARAKLSYFIEQLSALLPFKNKIRPTVVPGRYESLTYIQRAMFYGPLAMLMDPSSIPPGMESITSLRSVADPSMRLLLELIVYTLNKYRKERLSFDDKQIKELIAIRNEKERVNVIKEFDKLTDEERAVELMNKKLGLGKWSVGGTKLIYAYDADYYDQERNKREQAGIIDFPGLGPDEYAPLDGRGVDATGIFEYGGDADYEQEGGYNFEQTGEDDA